MRRNVASTCRGSLSVAVVESSAGGVRVAEGSSTCERNACTASAVLPPYTSRAKTIDVYIIQSGWVTTTPSLTVFPRVQPARENSTVRPVYTRHLYILCWPRYPIYYSRRPNGTGSAGQQSLTLYYVCNVMSVRCTYTIHIHTRSSGHHSGTVYDDVA